MDEPETCVTCAAPIAGDYCGRCGERRAALRDLRLRTFLRHAVEGLFNLDSSAWRTFGALVRRPGLLTAEYVAGRRRPWLSPIQVFLIANVAYFLVATSVVPMGTLTTSLRSQLSGQPYSELVRDRVRARFAADPAETVDFTAFEARFNFATEQYAKSLVLLLVPAFSVVIALLFIGRGVPFVQHLVLALHFVTFMLLALIAYGSVILGIAQLHPAAAGFLEREGTIALVMLALLAPWLTLALRRAYGARTLTAVLRAVVVFASIPFVLMAYRFVLFLVVIHSV